MSRDTTRIVVFPEFKADSLEACLILMYGAQDLGRRYALRDVEVTMGRDPSNQILIEASDVSRNHARLFRQGDTWHVEDLGSRNGTDRNGKPVIGPTPLQNGDLLKVGGVIFKFIAGGNLESLFHEEIYRMMIFDGLTHVANKRYLVDFLDREVARAQRYGSPLSLAMIDVDLFKKVNDTWGHAAGDYVLERMANAMSALVRPEQLLARFGGEEFALILPELHRDEVRAFCESLRVAVEHETFEHSGAKMPVTISIGAATLAPGMKREDLLQAADAQLYRAKRAGRNCVILDVDER